MFCCSTEDLIEAKCTVDDDQPKKKAKTIHEEEALAGFDLEEATYGDSSAGFEPLHLLSEWVEPGTTTRRLTVAILLPSGVYPGHFSVRVADGGCILNVTVTWPSPLVDLTHLHRKWLQSKGPERMEMYHPKMIGFEKFLKSCRSRNVDSVESMAKITLPFKVQTHISEKYHLGWNDNTARIVYVELRGHEENYGAVKDDGSFEIF